MTKQNEQTAGTMTGAGNIPKKARIAALDERNKKNRVVMGEAIKALLWAPECKKSGIGMAPERRLLSAEQKEELQNVFRRVATPHLPYLAECCTPLNLPWIFGVMEEIAEEYQRRDKNGDECRLFPLMLMMEFPLAYLQSRNTLKGAIETRLNAIHDFMPELLNNIGNMSLLYDYVGFEKWKEVAAFFSASKVTECCIQEYSPLFP